MSSTVRISREHMCILQLIQGLFFFPFNSKTLWFLICRGIMNSVAEHMNLEDDYTKSHILLVVFFISF